MDEGRRAAPGDTMAIGLKRLYERHLLPTLVHRACSLEPQVQQRAQLVPLASGRVLEIGAGSGLNLPFYDAGRVRTVIALEPAAEMVAIARRQPLAVRFPTPFLRARAEDVPLRSASVDVVVVTYALCTIERPLDALAEIRRVLKPRGRLLFCEHGLAPDAAVRRWQRRLSPLWRHLAGGCRLDRDIADLVRRGGFAVRQLSTLYVPGWKPLCFTLRGTAVPSSSRR